MTQATELANAGGATANQLCRPGKYLTFQLDSEEYGFEILKVREIIGLMEITPVPGTPDYIRGVINLRGKVIPVINLRQKFGMEMTEDTKETCVVVLDVKAGNGSILTGVVVDAVSEVLDVKAEQIEETPSFGADVNLDFIMGIGKIKDEVKMLIDIDKIIDTVDLSAVSDIDS